MSIVHTSLKEMSMAAGILIIGIVLFRLLFVRRIPKRIMVILWEIVVLRLLLPFVITFPLPGITALITEKFGTVSDDYSFGTVVVTSTDLGMGNAKGIFWTAEIPQRLYWSDILTVLYLAGIVVMCVGSVYLYLRDSRLFRESLPMEKCEKMRLIKLIEIEDKEWGYLEKIDFRISDRTATPVTYGVFRPAIVFPKGILLKEEKELGLCLLHELVHIRNHDNLKKLVVHAALCIHWFNPLVWLMYSLFNRDIELLCDETAVRKCMADKQDYALALLSMAERRAAGFRTALGFGKNAVKERILAVMTAGETKISSMAAAVLAVILALTAFLGTQTFAAGVVAAEYVITADEGAETSYGDGAQEYTYTVTDELGAAYATVNIVTVEAEDTAEQLVDTAEQSVDAVTLASADEEIVQAQAMEATEWMGDVIMPLQKLADEFAVYGLQVQISSDDYQLYFGGEPVYFFADNQNLDGTGFSGRVYAREAGNGNGDTGVVTKRDEDGAIIGLVRLSEEESRDVAKAWTGGGWW
ncbi:MAG: M56 family metallopeptidase [Lachnospiraceae bacterium]|nr:M56 family metallopeptidase [Lachnospiraceae bacterium]